MDNSEADKERLELYSEVHLRNQQDLTNSEKISVLEKKLRSKTIHLVINVTIIVIFIFMFAGGLTTFPEWFYYILFGVFALNVFLVHLQKKQIRSLLDYLKRKI
jgi:uncharacterized membrane protein